MLVKVIAVQARIDCPLSLAAKIHIFKQRPDFVCLPEYWGLDASIADHHRAALRHAELTEGLIRLSEELRTTLIAGTIVAPHKAGLHNSALIIRNGRVLGGYDKRNLMPGELAAGLVPGDKPMVVEVDGIRVATLICGDVFTPEYYDQLGERQADLIFIPTASPKLDNDRLADKQKRDRGYFVGGAERAGAFVIKVCGVGRLFGKPLQGRSLITAPWGMLSQVPPEDEMTERVVTETLDIDELREFRRCRLSKQ